MLVVHGIYDGKVVRLLEPIQVESPYRVTVTFLEPLGRDTPTQVRTTWNDSSGCGLISCRKKIRCSRLSLKSGQVTLPAARSNLARRNQHSESLYSRRVRDPLELQPIRVVG